MKVLSNQLSSVLSVLLPCGVAVVVGKMWATHVKSRWRRKTMSSNVAKKKYEGTTVRWRQLCLPPWIWRFEIVTLTLHWRQIWNIFTDTSPTAKTAVSVILSRSMSSVLTTLMSCQFWRLCPAHTLFQCFTWSPTLKKLVSSSKHQLATPPKLIFPQLWQWNVESHHVLTNKTRWTWSFLFFVRFKMWVWLIGGCSRTSLLTLGSSSTPSSTWISHWRCSVF